MTREQRIRVADATVDAALMVMGYDSRALQELPRGVLARHELERRGATEAVQGLYRIEYSLVHDEVAV